ncbi:MAG TPA: ABC transporter permease [Thermoanaerobaculia bacterium]|nr:ABC transporter permease [Thermoanaerobaculia bacterium]
MRRDVRSAIRWLATSPGFALTAILCLALGIGANTAAFSLTRAVLWQSLPFAHSDRVVVLFTESKATGKSNQPSSGLEFLDYQKRFTRIRPVAAVRTSYVNFTGTDQPRRLLVARASASLFSVVAVEPLLGRFFAEAEDRVGVERVVVLSETFWRNQLGGDPGVVGKKLGLDGAPATVIGVAPKAFSQGLTDRFELFLPLALDVSKLPDRGQRALTVLGLLTPGTSLGAAQAEMNRVAAEFGREHPDFYPANAGWGIRLVPLAKQLVGDFDTKLVLLLAIVGLVLAIACGNVANLLLARSSTRHREVAIRVALGSERGDLVRQLLVEGTLLALAGAVVGLALAFVGLRFLTSSKGLAIPRLESVAIDPVVLAFTLLISLLIGALFGLAPFLLLRRPDLAAMFKEGDGGKSSAGPAARLAQKVLLIGQVALATAVLITSGLLVRSFLRLQQSANGFDPRNTLTYSLFLSPNKYPERHLYTGFYHQVLERMRALPGVRAAGVVYELPLGARRFAVETEFEGYEIKPGEPFPMTDWRPASPGYFKAQGISLVAGRDLEESDDEKGEQVAVVSQETARRFWPGQEALGKKLRLIGRPGGAAVAQWLRVVGVVADVRTLGLDREAPATIYTPYPQATFPAFSVVLRTEGKPEGLASAVRQAVASIDHDQPIEDLASMESKVNQHLAGRRTYVWLMGLFALVALTLVAIGVHGLMAFLVSQRRSEIGIRMALGSERKAVFQLVLRQVLSLAGWGVALGILLALLASRWITSQLYGVGSFDLLTFVAVPALLLALATLSTLLPARAALSVNPVSALRRA